MSSNKLVDIPVDKSEKITQLIAGFTIVFFVPSPSNLNKKGVGSGTFVRYNGKLGILTAAHVIESLLTSDLKIIEMPHPITANLQQVAIASVVVFSRNDNLDPSRITGSNPDLGFIELQPSFNISDFQKSAWDLASGPNLRMKVSDTVEASQSVPYQLWAICGVPSCNRRIVRDEREDRDINIFEDAGCFLSAIKSECICEVNIKNINYVVDVVTITISEDYSSKLPKTFQGASGGGLWWVIIDSETFDILEILLIGVLCAEDIRPSPTKLYCRGPRCLYDGLLPQLKLIGDLPA